MGVLEQYVDMQDWLATYAPAIAAGFAHMNQAEVLRVQLIKPVADFSQCSFNFSLISQMLDYMMQATKECIGYGYAKFYTDCIRDGVLMAAEFPAVDWKGICQAWWEAPLPGWGWTIQLIDFMRKGIWNEPENIINQESFLT